MAVLSHVKSMPYAGNDSFYVNDYIFCNTSRPICTNSTRYNLHNNLNINWGYVCTVYAKVDLKTNKSFSGRLLENGTKYALTIFIC